MKSALIAIDDPATRLQVLRSLGRGGWWVDAVDDVESALRYLDKYRRDVVLIDWRISEGSGLALLTAIRAHATWRRIPAVMLHDGIETDEIERAFELGANDFLAHPFTDQTVRRTLGRWVLDFSGPAEKRSGVW